MREVLYIDKCKLFDDKKKGEIDRHVFSYTKINSAVYIIYVNICCT